MYALEVGKIAEKNAIMNHLHHTRWPEGFPETFRQRYPSCLGYMHEDKRQVRIVGIRCEGSERERSQLNLRENARNLHFEKAQRYFRKHRTIALHNRRSIVNRPFDGTQTGHVFFE
jgi:hypothetical protein